MTNDGPRWVNLALSGIIDHDISTMVTQELAANLIKAADFKTLVIGKNEDRKIVLSPKNPSDKNLF